MKQILNLFSQYVVVAVLFLAISHQAHAFYEPNQQRWLNRDPIQEKGGINLYQHVYSNPVNLTDPDGRFVPLLISAFAIGAVLAEEPANAPGIVDQGEPMLGLGDHLEAGAGSALFAGVGAGVLKAGGFLAKKPCPSTVPVSRWGGPLQPGKNWVMTGEASRWNFLMSGKMQPEWFPTFGQPPNIPATYSSGVTINVPPSSLSWPTGLDFWKGIVGQRMYNP